MKKWALLCCFVGFFMTIHLQAQSVSYMYITTQEVQNAWKEESFISITEADGTQHKNELKRIFSGGKTKSEESVPANDLIVTQTLNKYARQGWKVISITVSPSQEDDTSAILLTRYVLEKKVE